MTFQISRLSNNLPVISYSMPSFRTVAFNYIVGVGSRYEKADQEGLSHFLEHMAFKGTNTRTAANIAEEFDEIGGQFNAYTSKEHTIYYAKVIDSHKEKALDIIADIIQNSVYKEEDIKKEYGVICQEIAQTQDNPDELCYEHLISKAFPDQSLGKPIAGTEESIAKFNSDTFQSYVSDYYTSKNSLLSVAGNISHEELVKLAEDKFGNLEAGQSVQANSSQYDGGLALKIKDLEQSTLFLGFKSSSYKDLDMHYKTQMLSLILGGGLSSRLFQTVREKHGLAYSVGSFNTTFSDNGIFSLYAGTSHDKVGFVLDAFLDEIKKIQDSVNEQELFRAKEQIKSCIIMSEEKTAYKSEEVGKNYFLFDREIKTQEVIDRVESTQISDLTDLASKLFTGNPTISAIGPKLPEIDIDSIKAKLK